MNKNIRKIVLSALVLMNLLLLASCGHKKDIVGYNNNGAVDAGKMTDLAFERIHYGVATIQYEDRTLFSSGYKRNEFPGLITNQEDWDILQDKLGIELGEVDFEEYVVWNAFDCDIFTRVYTVPTYVNYIGYCDEEIYYSWNSSECVRFEAEDETDRLCGFDMLKIKKADFPSPRSVMGLAHNTGGRTESNISVKSHGYYLYK